ncbi:MAG: hypothetical protein R3F33_04735 [Planctomycetota bacterium]
MSPAFRDTSSSLEPDYRRAQLLHLDPETFGFLYRRSLLVRVFAVALGLGTAALAAMALAGMADTVVSNSAMPWIGAVATLGFYAAATVGASYRTAWGQRLCAGIALFLLAQSAWHFSSPSHWALDAQAVGMVLRLAIGYVGCLAFFGTEELFGRGGLGHAQVKDAWAEFRDEQEELARVHAMDWTPRRDRAA